MPVINVDDLTDKDKAVMEVNQLKVEVKLERWLVSGSFGDVDLLLRRLDGRVGCLGAGDV